MMKLIFPPLPTRRKLRAHSHNGVNSTHLGSHGDWYASPLTALFDTQLTDSLARELTLDAAQATRGARTSSRPLDRNQMKKLLDSRNEREVLDGLRRVLAVCCAVLSGDGAWH